MQSPVLWGPTTNYLGLLLSLQIRLCKEYRQVNTAKCSAKGNSRDVASDLTSVALFLHAAEVT